MQPRVRSPRPTGGTRFAALTHVLVAVLVGVTASVATARGASAQTAPDRPEVTVTELTGLDPGTRMSSIYDINNAGQVVGTADLADDRRVPVVWEDGRAVELQIDDERTLTASEINDRGDVVAVSLQSYHWRDGQVTPLPAGDVVDLNERGQVLLDPSGSSIELWRDGITTDVNLPPPPEGLSIRLAGLSDGGHVVFEYGKYAPSLGFSIWRGTGGVLMWHRGTVTTLTSDEVVAQAVNRHGQVVGVAGNRAPFSGGGFDGVLLSRGRTTRLDFVPVDINDRGQVVGHHFDLSNGQTQAVLWQNGRVTELGTLGGDSSEAIAVNERGQVLGESTAADGTTHAFLWTRGHMVDLGRVGFHGGLDYALNDKGQAIGPGWTPSPAPPIIPDAKPVMWTVHD
jgi:probable HAF family extracellular repeat protein